MISFVSLQFILVGGLPIVASGVARGREPGATSPCPAVYSRSRRFPCKKNLRVRVARGFLEIPPGGWQWLCAPVHGPLSPAAAYPARAFHPSCHEVLRRTAPFFPRRGSV